MVTSIPWIEANNQKHPKITFFMGFFPWWNPSCIYSHGLQILLWELSKPHTLWNIQKIKHMSLNVFK